MSYNLDTALPLLEAINNIPDVVHFYLIYLEVVCTKILFNPLLEFWLIHMVERGEGDEGWGIPPEDQGLNRTRASLFMEGGVVGAVSI
jgi:hypothetical protein